MGKGQPAVSAAQAARPSRFYLLGVSHAAFEQCGNEVLRAVIHYLSKTPQETEHRGVDTTISVAA